MSNSVKTHLIYCLSPLINFIFNCVGYANICYSTIQSHR